jgi:hypothetical protein
MAHDESDVANGATSPDLDSWTAEYAARLAQTAQEMMQLGAAAADRWARRSLEDAEWSVESVTADVIADWEEATPLLGRWLDLCLEALQRGNRGARPGEQ